MASGTGPGGRGYSGYGRGGRGAALLQALEQPVRRPGDERREEQPSVVPVSDIYFKYHSFYKLV